jgi:hypothetical protein
MAGDSQHRCEAVYSPHSIVGQPKARKIQIQKCHKAGWYQPSRLLRNAGQTTLWPIARPGAQVRPRDFIWLLPALMDATQPLACLRGLTALCSSGLRNKLCAPKGIEIDRSGKMDNELTCPPSFSFSDVLG